MHLAAIVLIASTQTGTEHASKKFVHKQTINLKFMYTGSTCLYMGLLGLLSIECVL